MSLEQDLFERSGSQCELCGTKDELHVWEVPDSPVGVEKHILICNTCSTQVEDPELTEPNHWRCLNDSMWSTIPAIQVMAWRMLNRLRGEGWPQDLLDMMYMEEEQLEWAKTGQGISETKTLVHKDSNGAIINQGDSVVLIKDLNVKGSSLVAKRGTAVRRVSLVHDNAEQLEGKVEGQQIVILTKFVKKI